MKSDKCMGVSQLLGARASWLPPKSTPTALYVFSAFVAEGRWFESTSGRYVEILGNG